jgi:hypothetical protein
MNRLRMEAAEFGVLLDRRPRPFRAFQPGSLDVRIVRGPRSNAGYWSGTPPTSGGAEPSAVKKSVPCAAVEKARWPVVPKFAGTAVE